MEKIVVWLLWEIVVKNNEIVLYDKILKSSYPKNPGSESSPHKKTISIIFWLNLCRTFIENNTMKRRLVVLAIFIFASLSCHKRNNSSKKTCSGYFLTVTGYTSGGASGATNTLEIIDANTGQNISVLGSSFEFGNYSGNGVYDNATGNYYMYASSSATGGRFYRFPIETRNIIYLYSKYYTSTICDTLTNWWIQNELLCNSAAGKLYFVSHGPHVDRIYRIDTTGVFHETQIFAADSVGAISAPVVDENTGYIYFFSAPYLMKVDPASGISSVVANCPNLMPAELQYDSNDSMFYGINLYAQTYGFIRINPVNGVVTTLAYLNYYTIGMGHSFDVCNNVYIVKDHWLDPSSGKTVKTMSWDDYGLTYINNP